MAVDLESPSNFITTRLRQAVNWGRKYSLWPLPFGVACCAIEFMSTVSSYNDISRFGAELLEHVGSLGRFKLSSVRLAGK